MIKLVLGLITVLIISLPFYLSTQDKFNQVESFSKVTREEREKVRRTTSLHLAIQQAPLNEIENILMLGIPIDAQNKDGHTALHLAAFYERLDVVELLVGFGASSDIEDDNGDKPIDLIMTTPSNNDLISFLRTYGEKVERKKKKDSDE